jgi:hypothetical protein
MLDVQHPFGYCSFVRGRCTENSFYIYNRISHCLRIMYVSGCQDSRESMVSDIPAVEGKTGNLFYSVDTDMIFMIQRLFR